MSYVRFTNKSSISSSSQLLLCSPFPRVIDIEICLKTLKINQRVDSDVNLIVWDASLVLAKYLELMCERKSDFLSGVKVLELGAGVGLVGLTAAILGAQVTLTDLPETLPLLQSNILENQAAISSMGGYATADILNWGDRLATIGEFDMVLVADGISNADDINPLLSTLNRISLEYTTKPVIYLTQEIRQSQKESIALFLTKLNEHFSVEEIPEEEQHCNFRSPDIMLLKIIHK